MWSERHALNRQMASFIVGFFLVFTAAAALTWYLQLRRMRLLSLEVSARHLTAPLFGAARQELDKLALPQSDPNPLLVSLQNRGTQLFPALLETIEHLEGLRVVDAQGRTLFSSGEWAPAAGGEWSPSSTVRSRRRGGRIEVAVPLLWGQEVVAGVVCLYGNAAGEVHACRFWYAGLGVVLVLGLIGGVGTLLAGFRLTRALRRLVARAEAIGAEPAASPAPPTNRGELHRLSVSLDRLARRLMGLESRYKILTTAIENSDEEVVITDRDARIQYVNPAFEKNSGYLKAEVVGKNPRLLKSGEQRQHFYRELWRTLLAGRVWRGRLVNRCKDGRHIFLDAIIAPIIDDQGAITGFVAVRRDVGEKVRMERQLIQSQKMEAIGTLAGGIAHDFNNILAGILGYAEMALLDLPPDSAVYKNLTQIHSGGERARELVQQILTYSRQSKVQPRLLDVPALLTETLELLRASLPANIRIERQLVAAGAVIADATQIHQIVMNLCTNAAHAMAPQGGTLTVTLAKAVIDGEHELIAKGVAPGAYLRLEVADTGQGMPAALQKRVFDPYFTTKARGKGTGMGLAVVHGIVQQLGGHIFLESEVAAGSRFDVYLPVVDADAGGEEGAGPVRYQGRGVAFFVDDEPPLVEIGCRMMAHMGFEPRGFHGGPAALKAFEADPAAVDLVVTDMTMPEVTGDVLAERMLALRPDLPVILCSGFSEYIDEVQAAERGIGVFLNKPFSLQELAAAVKSLLPQPPPDADEV